MKKVLIIDDDHHHRDLCRMMIESKFNDIEVIELAGIDDAFNTIKLERPICIVLDNMMPGGSGLVLLHNLRDNMAKCPPILFISCAMDENLSRNADAFSRQGGDVIPIVCMSKLEAVGGGIIDAIEAITGERRGA